MPTKRSILNFKYIFLQWLREAFARRYMYYIYYNIDALIN